MKSYGKTKTACYLGFITQAITVNFITLLFIKLHSDYSISFGKIALIPTYFFFTQLLTDIFCSKFVDRIGYRPCIVASEFFASSGLLALAFLPEILPNPYAGILISVVIYAVGSGLIEVLCSPIMEACPFKNKERTMSLLHSFYCWGTRGTILLSSLFFYLFGIKNWRWLSVLWALIPAVNIYNFATCPIEPIVKQGKQMHSAELFSKPMFWVSLALMICSGASELCMAQWASAYTEASLGLSKNISDLLGPCMFAFTMGICRMIYGKFGSGEKLTKYMALSTLMCIVCYVLATFTNNSVLGLLGCVFCGFSVAIMWPGTLSVSSAKFPEGGTAMFAFLAMAGDLGGSIGPALAGRFIQKTDDNVKNGLKIGIIFPVILLFLVLIVVRESKNIQGFRKTLNSELNHIVSKGDYQK